MAERLKAHQHPATGRMGKGTFSSLLLSLCVLGAGNASAAEENTTDSKENPSPVDNTLVVTGEKVTRSIYDTGSSVKVYDKDAIDALPHAVDIRDIMQMIPNITDTGMGNDLPTIRGLDGSGPATGATAFFTGSRPRINMSVDGRSLSYNEMAFGSQSLWDIDRTEVFLGPQSYVQGRNAIAGAVVMTTRDPTFEWESAVKGGFGTQNSTQTAAMLSGPLIEDELAFRLSVDRQRRKSYVDLINYDPYDGDVRQIETNTARMKLLYNPSNLRELSTKLTVNHFDSIAPQNEALSPETNTTARYDRRRPVFQNQYNSTIWDISWDQSEQFSLSNKMIYTGFNQHRHAYTAGPSANVGGHEFQTSPLVHFATDDNVWHGLAGINYFRASQDEDIYLFGGSYFKDETQTASAFAELTYALTEQVDVTASSRVEREHRRRVGSGGASAVDFDETWDVFLPKLDVAWKPMESQTYGAKVSRGYNGGGAGITFSAPLVTYTYDPEYVWNYELYSRHHIDAANLDLTSNIFYNDYKNMQLPYSLASGSTVISNADKVETYGAELGAIWKPTLDFELNSSVGLLKTKIKEFGGSTNEGNALPRAPGYTANVGAKYMLLPGVELSGNVKFSGSYYSAYDNDSEGRISPYWISNVQLAYTFQYGRATLYAQNLFDSDHSLSISANDRTTAITQRERLVGTSLELNF
ncbi:TonB-dependent receptor [Erwinia sp. JH02]|uniref:TonB-dependent receptor n=1 Tax=Erwinia sp. JH02 TaxID=2733394 RepID=UPI001489A9DD|nr:TonB-dependent receptor [Erwinia sp. JH02]NNS10141.1 TonB-dependent receptor [Erwinia sp. JH02]